MVNVIIAGVPKDLKLKSFIEFMEKNIFQQKIDVKVNYLRWFKRDLKKLSLSMKSNDARRAIRYLNGYEYSSRRRQFSLGCWKEDAEDRNDSEDDFEPPSKIRRTLSPSNEPDELEVIDRKIELIRKQRILLEEESQLLLEKKRLQIIQNLGPNDFQKLSELEEMGEINLPITEKLVKGQFKKGSNFQGPWKIIYENMKGIIKAYVDAQNRPIFTDLLRSRVKNRLALILKDKGYMRAREILTLYRSLHPEESDIDLVQEILMKINQMYPKNITTNYNDGEDNEQDTDEIYDLCDTESVEEIGLNEIQNEDVTIHKDVKEDIDDNPKQNIATTEKELDLEKNQCPENKINDENIHIIKSETNSTNTDENEIDEMPKETSTNDCEEKESNERLEEAPLNVNEEMSINEREFTLVTTNKEVDPAVNDVFDMDNDLDDWDEDERDNQQQIKTAE